MINHFSNFQYLDIIVKDILINIDQNHHSRDQKTNPKTISN